MRRFLLLFLFPLSIIAQDTANVKVPTLGGREDQLILNFTSDNWSGLPTAIKSKPLRSRGFSFLLMTDKMNRTGNFGFAMGLGFMSQNVHTDAEIITTDSAASLGVIPDSLNLDVNKLSTNFITASLELRLRSNENKRGGRFKLSAGVIAAYLLQSHTKREDDLYGKFKTYGIKHLEKFQYGFTGRIGYNNIGICVYYSMKNVFKKDRGPELTPYSIGIALTL